MNHHSTTLRNTILAVITIVTCSLFIGCNNSSGVHQQVLERIAQAEGMLEEADIDSSITLLQQTYDFAKGKNY